MRSVDKETAAKRGNGNTTTATHAHASNSAAKPRDLPVMLQQHTPSKHDNFVSPGMALYTQLGSHDGAHSTHEGESRRSSLAMFSVASSTAPLARVDDGHYGMNKDELHEFRDYLVKSSLFEPASGSFASSGIFDPSASSSSTSSATTRDSRLPILTVHQPGNFVNITAHTLPASYISRASELMSVTKTLPYDEPGVMNNGFPLPRESVVVLIDAVRASTLEDNEKCRFLFELFDVDGRGVLSKQGVADFIDAMLVANNLQTYGDMNVNDIVDKLFAETADPVRMTYYEFLHAFQDVVQEPLDPVAIAHGQQQQGVATASMPASNQRDPQPQTQTQNTDENKPKKTVFQKWLKRYRKHDAEVHWLVVYFAVMVAAFIVKAQYVAYDPAVGYAPRIAKGFAQIIMVDTLFLLFPMCRKFVAFLRRFAEISSRVPVDQHIEFHKICGVVMLLASLGHTIAWVFIAYYLRTAPYELWQQSRFKHLTFVRYENLVMLVGRTPMWTGVVMLLIIFAAAPLTHPKIRGSNFNAFWITHLLFIPFLILILVHGLAMWVQPPQAFFWVLPPIVLYVIERRFRMKSVKGGNTKIVRVRFSKDTVAMYMEKPRGFHYHPGMYLYLKMPLLSTFEWHPFTISSAPEDDYVSVHIRKAGDWTGALHTVLRQVVTQHSGQDTVHELDARGLAQSPFPVVFIDGPVGAPSQEYYRYKSVVFVGAGIGVTPFASILQSIMHQWEAFRCAQCNSVTLPKSFPLEKIHFYWITRDQEALTWFAETMNQLAALDPEGRLEIHNYYSPLKSEKVIAPLHALQKFIHDTEGQDIISGLATKQITHFGRPDWKQELERIARQHHQQQDVQLGNSTASAREIGVFFCGPKPLGHSIHDECTKFNQDNTRTCPDVVYDFHSENF